MIKICMITGTMSPAKCGVGDYTEILCNELSNKNDVNLSVITTIGLGEGISKYKVYPIVERWNIHALGTILKKLEEISPDVVHIQYPTTEYKKNIFINFLPFILKLKKYKVVTTIHEYSDNSKLGKIRIWPNILFSDSVIVVDPRFKKEINDKTIFKNKIVNYVNIGSNIPKSYINDNERIELKLQIFNSERLFVIGYFGFINNKKGLETILYSLSNLIHNEGKDVKLLIIGNLNPKDDYHKSLIDLIDKLNLRKYVHITGYLSKEEVGKYINITDVMAFPFVNGVSPRNGSFLAAIQENRPVITTLPKTNDFELHVDKIQFLNNYDDSAALASKILTLVNNGLSNNKEENKTDNNIDWKTISERHIEFYYELTK